MAQCWIIAAAAVLARANQAERAEGQQLEGTVLQHCFEWQQQLTVGDQLLSPFRLPPTIIYAL